MICTIRTYQDNGPYFPATKGCYQARSLKDLLFHARLAMEDREDVIGLFDADGACKGIWQLAVKGTLIALVIQLWITRLMSF
jgi:hypothetical protein